MKSNKVRMNISREMHEWFTAIDGKTNDERMQRVINDMAKYKARAESAESSLINHKVMYGSAVNHVGKLSNNNRILKGLLGLSMTVSTISVSYLAYAQGWFL